MSLHRPETKVVAGAVPVGAASEQPSLRQKRVNLVPWLYLAPTLLLLALFTYWPLLQTAYLSMVNWNLNPGQPTEFVGLDNYGRVAGSTLFQAALVNTLIYIGASIPLKVLLPIPVAIFLWSLGQ